MVTYLEFDEVLATFYDCVTKEVTSGEKTAILFFKLLHFSSVGIVWYFD